MSALVIKPDIAVDALKSLTHSHGDVHDPVNIGRVARRIERRYRGVGLYTIEDVDNALKEAERQGLVREVKVGDYSHGFAMTTKGMEEG